jgi:hypothetical protein
MHISANLANCFLSLNAGVFFCAIITNNNNTGLVLRPGLDLVAVLEVMQTNMALETGPSKHGT